MKKIFIASSIALFLILVFLGIYNFAFKKNSSIVLQGIPNTDNSILKNQNTQSVQQTQINQKISAISNQAVLSATYNKKDNNILAYAANDGTLWKASEDGKKWQQITQQTFPGLKNVSWSLDKTKTLLTVDSSNGDTFFEYDLLLNKKTTLKSGLDTAVWDNLGEKIFYKYFDAKTGARSLNIANPDGSGWQKISDVNFRNISIAEIPLTSVISYWNKPSQKESSTLQTVTTSGSDQKSLFQGKQGADYLWSPNGQMALVSSLATDGSGKITLGLLKNDGNYSDLNIPTFVSKCIWSSDGKTVYYALPGDIPTGAVLPDDYQNNKFTTNDTFWKMDITTGIKERIIEPSETAGVKYDSASMFLSETEDALYFINKTNKLLYRINL